MARVMIDPEFVVSIRNKLDEVKYLPFGEGKEEGGELAMDESSGWLKPKGVNQGKSASVTIPRTRFVYHTHPSTCGPEAAGCSYDPPSETDMRNAARAAICNNQQASVVFSQKGVYVIQVRHEFVRWFKDRVAGVKLDEINGYMRRAFKQMQNTRVKAGSGPHYRKYLFNAAFVRSWLRFANRLKVYIKGGRAAVPSTLARVLLGLGADVDVAAERKYFAESLDSSPYVFSVSFFSPRSTHVYVALDV